MAAGVARRCRRGGSAEWRRPRRRRDGAEQMGGGIARRAAGWADCPDGAGPGSRAMNRMATPGAQTLAPSGSCGGVRFGPPGESWRDGAAGTGAARPAFPRRRAGRPLRTEVPK